ncbi:HIT family protein [Massilia sp. TS11]|uniref:HIT family protein n=1 Tax=Massilia sp. TS11 TaxID=2908003 RepID=UPI001EDA962C|nr:HIT family protein [Massilia sp. TS11]MCG2584971.1 HIT family protein [Massilia sp. TS11]
MSECELCAARADTVYSDAELDVILVDDAQHPGFCRVIWRAHVREMSDLSPAERQRLMDVVWQVEGALRAVMQPHKLNLASLGNVVPHLHWHVIPRYPDDAQFPAPVWAAAVRVTPEATLAARRALLPQLRAAIQERLQHA